MSAEIVTEAAAGRAIDDLALQLKGLVHVRALLETRGVSAVELEKHTNAIARVREELARTSKVQAMSLAVKA